MLDLVKVSGVMKSVARKAALAKALVARSETAMMNSKEIDLGFMCKREEYEGYEEYDGL